MIVAVSPEDPYYQEIDLLKSEKIKVVFGGETRAKSVYQRTKIPIHQ